MSQAARPISEELHLTKAQMGSVFSAFALAYAMPGGASSGWLGDFMGLRRVLVRNVLQVDLQGAHGRRVEPRVPAGDPTAFRRG